MQLTTVQLVSIVITLVLTILPGIYAGRKIKSADDYALGGRSAGIGMVAGSIIGTIVGGAATIGTAQLGFQLGLTAWWFTLGFIVCHDLQSAMVLLSRSIKACVQTMSILIICLRICRAI